MWTEALGDGLCDDGFWGFELLSCYDQEQTDCVSPSNITLPSGNNTSNCFEVKIRTTNCLSFGPDFSRSNTHASTWISWTPAFTLYLFICNICIKTQTWGDGAIIDDMGNCALASFIGDGVCDKNLLPLYPGVYVYASWASLPPLLSAVVLPPSPPEGPPFSISCICSLSPLRCNERPS